MATRPRRALRIKGKRENIVCPHSISTELFCLCHTDLISYHLTGAFDWAVPGGPGTEIRLLFVVFVLVMQTVGLYAQD